MCKNSKLCGFCRFCRTHSHTKRHVSFVRLELCAPEEENVNDDVDAVHVYCACFCAVECLIRAEVDLQMEVIILHHLTLITLNCV